MSLTQLYTERRDLFEERFLEAKRKAGVLSAIRLGLFVLMAVGVYFAIKSFSWPIGIALILLLALFLFLVSLHEKEKKTRSFNEELSKINAAELKALNLDLSPFESGAEYIDSSHDYAFDMDLFGEHSLYQLINRTRTQSGKTLLKDILCNTLSEASQVIDRQQIVKELAGKLDFRQSFMAEATVSDEKTSENKGLLEWLREPPSFRNKTWLQVLRFLLPILMVGLCVTAWFDPRFRSLAMLMGVVNLVFVFFLNSKISEIHGKISKENGVLTKYLALLSQISREEFEHPELNAKKLLASDSLSSIKSFSRIVNRFDQRLNFLVAIFLNAFYLADIQNVFALEKWKEANKENLLKWLEVLFYFDAHNSLANFAALHPHFIYPTITEKGSNVAAVGLGHPLIKKEECVTNDLTIGDNERMVILTGANMSGKSTFLRSLGVNTILALIGAPVSATSFSTPILEVITSMRLTDSLNERASYFYSELKRLQMIVEELETGKSLLIILDEILKGTNSEDKLTGSIELIKKFVAFDAYGIVATHDLELGKLEDDWPNEISNHCFESTIADDELTFDYKLYPGIAKNKNATFLMKKMGIV